MLDPWVDFIAPPVDGRTTAPLSRLPRIGVSTFGRPWQTSDRDLGRVEDRMVVRNLHGTTSAVILDSTG